MYFFVLFMFKRNRKLNKIQFCAHTQRPIPLKSERSNNWGIQQEVKINSHIRNLLSYGIYLKKNTQSVLCINFPFHCNLFELDKFTIIILKQGKTNKNSNRFLFIKF